MNATCVFAEITLRRLILALLVVAAFGLGIDGLWFSSQAGDDVSRTVAQSSRSRRLRERRERLRREREEKAEAAAAESEDKPDAAEDAGPPPPPPKVEYEAVRLADGSEVQVEKYGETYQAYDYRPPLNLDDISARGQQTFDKHAVHVVLDYADPRYGLRDKFPNRDLRSICLDVEHNHMYWIDCYPNYASRKASIHRANLNGERVQTLVEDLYDPRQLALDLKNGMMYWVEAGTETAGIHRAHLDGSAKEHFLRESVNTCAVDGQNGILYYVTPDHNGRLFRMRTDDGGGETLIAEGARSGWALTESPNGRELFWTAISEGKILRADVTTHQIAVAIQNADPVALAINPVDNKVYWNSPPMTPALWRANLDGSQMEMLASGLAMPRGIRARHKASLCVLDRNAQGLPRSRRLRANSASKDSSAAPTTNKTFSSDYNRHSATPRQSRFAARYSRQRFYGRDPSGIH